ncbi:Hpt domain-containing protein [Massilia consociata]|uniref:Hpt domain-containing protein n=1 Tax=Massilia consociata TaxID=760117 RepID=A0ABV6FJ35_9BURK
MNARPSSGMGAFVTPEAAHEPPLDCCAGLERVMGDQAMYLRILTRFRLDYCDNVARLRAALDAGDTALAQRIAHTLKGAAAMIEARPLRALAADVEQGLRANGRVHPQLVDRLEGELARVMTQLDALLPAPAAPRPPRDVAPAARVAAEAVIARLCELLDIGDSAALNLIAEQDACLLALLGAERMAELESAAARFDFERALQVLRPGH